MHTAKTKIGYRGTHVSPRLQVFAAKGIAGGMVAFQQAPTEIPFLRKLERVI